MGWGKGVSLSFQWSQRRFAMDISMISSGLAGIKTAIDVLRTTVNVRDDKMIEKAIGDAEREINNRIIAVQGTCLALQGEVDGLMKKNRELEEEIRYLSNQAAEEGKYELYHTRAGGVCYKLKDSMNPSGKPVYLCATCMGEGKKSFLQYGGRGDHLLMCGNKHPSIPSDNPDPGLPQVRTTGREW
jgi:hypothetical protein